MNKKVMSKGVAPWLCPLYSVMSMSNSCCHVFWKQRNATVRMQTLSNAMPLAEIRYILYLGSEHLQKAAKFIRRSANLIHSIHRQVGPIPITSRESLAVFFFQPAPGQGPPASLHSDIAQTSWNVVRKIHWKSVLFLNLMNKDF